MLEKLILTLSSVTLVSTLGAGYVWAQGGFEPSHDLSTVAKDAPATYHGPAVIGGDPQPGDPSARRTTGRATRPHGPATSSGGNPGSGPGAQLADVGGAQRTAAGALRYRVTTGSTTGAAQVSGQTVPASPATTQTATQTATQTGPRADFNIATFNLLGSSHTKGSRRYASGPARMPGALQILAQHDITVAGFQEFQPDQRQAFTHQARGWAMYPGLTMGQRAGENSVAWRTDTWSLVDKGLVSIPYFSGHERPMPWVLLRNTASGRQVYVSTFHNPADVHGPAQRWRTEATTREVALFNRLGAGGTPQLVTGDMNERANYFCRITGETKLHAAAGGDHAGSCHLPQRLQIDWIFGSSNVTFSNYTIDRSDLVRRTTDHPVVVSHVTLG